MAARSTVGTRKSRAARADGDTRGTRQRFVDAAAALLSEGGYGAASVHNIAERVGVSAGALYRHFPSKAELFVEVVRDGAQRDLAVMRKVRAEGGAIDRLEVAIAAHARRALRDPRRAWALLHEPVDALVDAERLVYRRSYTRRVAWLLRQAMAAGEIPRQDVELSAAAIVGALAEALVGPLSPIPSEKPPDDDVIINHIVRFCRLAVGADATKSAARTTRSRKARAGSAPDAS